MKIVWPLLFVVMACQVTRHPKYLLKFSTDPFDELGSACGYINNLGDTIIKPGTYYYCYTDTLRYFAVVLCNNGKCIAIDSHENQLFEVFWFDNGPDIVQDGLFRIVKEGLIGYANKKGEIVVKPQYKCAYPYKNGIAKVAIEGSSQSDGEHTLWISDNWMYINKNGELVSR
nr:WG repeat-containing protein [uncultured Carboxylicivirga sp.]